MNVFEAVKQSVTTRQAAENYGTKLYRNNMAICPFHNDKNPSMKLDRRYHCFGCGADGDVIDFVSQLYGLTKKDAALKLAEDFGVPYDEWKPPDKRRGRTPPARKETPEQKYRRLEGRCFRVLCDYLHRMEQWKTQYAPRQPDEEWHPLFAEALQETSHVEYLLDILLTGEPEEKAALVAEQGKEVMKLEQRIRELDARDTGGAPGDDGRDGAADTGRDTGDADMHGERRRKKHHRELCDCL